MQVLVSSYIKMPSAKRYERKNGKYYVIIQYLDELKKMTDKFINQLSLIDEFTDQLLLFWMIF